MVRYCCCSTVFPSCCTLSTDRTNGIITNELRRLDPCHSRLSHDPTLTHKRPSYLILKVANMSLPWALGAGSSLSANEEDCIVIQLVGAVLNLGKHVPQAGCFALLRWDGKFAGRTPFCRNVHEPTWHAQVCESDGSKHVPKRPASILRASWKAALPTFSINLNSSIRSRWK